MPTKPRTGNADKDRADAALDAYSALRVAFSRLALGLHPERPRIAYMIRVILDDHR